jgi:predicted aspartyl protease
MRKTAIFLTLLIAFATSATEQVSGFLPGGLEMKAVRWYRDFPSAGPRLFEATDPYTIDSPQVVGFTPYVAVCATNKRLEDLEYEAVKEYYPHGSYLVSDPNSNYIVGIFDTGASSAVFGYEASRALGIRGSYLTSNMMTIGGITGTVDTYVSVPVGIYFTGLGAVDPATAELDITELVGLSNFSVLAGMAPDAGAPDLPTIIGSPIAASWTVSIDNDNSVTVVKGDETYASPSLTVHDYYDSDIPDYPNRIPLELRPLGAAMITYTPSLDGFSLDFSPASPSVITGISSQSLFFLGAVDLENNGLLAYDKTRFMFDTGAQSTIIGSRVAARLGLDPSEPDFELLAMGVTGEMSVLPGFVIDKLEIPALGNWLTFTNVPVVLHDVASPEGGTLDGIIGTNLFNDFNLVLNGGGMGFLDDPSIDFSPRGTPYISADLAPLMPDGTVDLLDLEVLISLWLSQYGDVLWQQRVDLAPYPLPDDVVNMLDFAEFAGQWKLW